MIQRIGKPENAPIQLVTFFDLAALGIPQEKITEAEIDRAGRNTTNLVTAGSVESAVARVSHERTVFDRGQVFVDSQARGLTIVSGADLVEILTNTPFDPQLVAEMKKGQGKGADKVSLKTKLECRHTSEPAERYYRKNGHLTREMFADFLKRLGGMDLVLKQIWLNPSRDDEGGLTSWSHNIVILRPVGNKEIASGTLPQPRRLNWSYLDGRTLLPTADFFYPD